MDWIKRSWGWLRGKPQHFELIGYGIMYQGAESWQWKNNQMEES